MTESTKASVLILGLGLSDAVGTKPERDAFLLVRMANGGLQSHRGLGWGGVSLMRAALWLAKFMSQIILVARL